jgi:NADPH:quinone reductase-like Zn-dependent oxidoreductase
MQAIYFDRTGEPADTLSLGEFDKPVPHVGEVLVRVLASPIHPADLLFVRGKYRFQPEFPQIAGMEGAGLVEIKGPGSHGVSLRSPWSGVRSYMDSKSAEEKKDIAQQLVDLLGKDDFELKAASHHPLASFKAALQEAAHGSDGKVLLKP